MARLGMLSTGPPPMNEIDPDVEERPGARRPRDPARTRRDILVAAREEFAEHGLEGARVDRIAERAGANKRMLYHYFGNKEALYVRILHDAYRDIREGETALQLGALPPKRAMEKLVGFTFDHFRANPWFIRLLATENIQRGAFVRTIPDLQRLRSPLIAQMHAVLAAGEAAGDFRAGVDPVQLYITIAGVSYFYLSNIHTLSVVFAAPLASEAATAARRAHAIEVILGYLRPGDALAAR
jgi:AcrR family transcriptional regulator